METGIRRDVALLADLRQQLDTRSKKLNTRNADQQTSEDIKTKYRQAAEKELGLPVVQPASIEDVLLGLSDAYTLLRAVQTLDLSILSKGAQEWIPPDSFQRSISKFWVRVEDIEAVKVAVLKHLPILTFNERQGLTQSKIKS